MNHLANNYFWFLVGGFELISLLWWLLIDRRLKAMRCRAWRLVMAIVAVATMTFPLISQLRGDVLPGGLPAAGWMWLAFAVPFGFVIFFSLELAFFVQKSLRRRVDPPVDLSRRHVITAIAATVPPLVAGGLSAVSISELGKFRVREVQVWPDGCPPELNGLTIALVADLHTGPYTSPATLAEVLRRTNTIHNGGPADLVILGGDLINTTLDDLPAGLKMATALQSRLGTYAIMGNHDVIDDRELFIRRVRAAGVKLLLEEVVTIPVGGTRFQLLGSDWAEGDNQLWTSVTRVAHRRDPSLFPICLSHHPHCWEEAIRRGLPLMLSGHTHGGQIMLTETIGAGPLKFRYWTGIHRRKGSTLIISNGVGNWFPLRVNAPAEILKIVLRPTSQTSVAQYSGRGLG